jgi:hypothetical protein
VIVVLTSKEQANGADDVAGRRKWEGVGKGGRGAAWRTRSSRGGEGLPCNTRVRLARTAISGLSLLYGRVDDDDVMMWWVMCGLCAPVVLEHTG